MVDSILTESWWFKTELSTFPRGVNLADIKCIWYTSWQFPLLPGQSLQLIVQTVGEQKKNHLGGIVVSFVSDLILAWRPQLNRQDLGPKNLYNALFIFLGIFPVQRPLDSNLIWGVLLQNFLPKRIIVWKRHVPREKCLLCAILHSRLHYFILLYFS